MTLVILPVDGQTQLCRVEAGAFSPLAPLPGAADARCFPDYATHRVAILDSNRKRAGLFEMLDREPWFNRLLPFSTLPAQCVGHTALALGDGLLVGGQSKSGEALWSRHPARAKDAWVPVELPARLKRPGKAIDGLHRQDDQLIAVDDIVVPKWLLLYRIDPEGSLALQKSVALPDHITYEQIFDSFLGKDELWLASRGVNYGRVGTFIWGVGRKTFRERACWSAYGRRQHEEAADPAPLFRARGVTEWQDRLLVPCGEQGLLQIPLRKRRARYEPEAPIRVEGLDLATVDSVQVVPADPAPGFFAIGTTASGVRAAKWVHRDALG